MKKLLTILIILNTILVFSQDTIQLTEKDSILINKYIDYGRQLDSLQNLLDSISQRSDSIFLSNMNSREPASMTYDEEINYPLVLYPSRILGPWTNHETENATFSFNEDSLLYIGALKNYDYRVENDILIVNYEYYIDSSRILKLTKDSLILKSIYGIYRFERFRE